MSTTRKAPLLVATAALGLIAATAIVVYAASTNRSSGQQPQRPQQQASDRSATEKRTSSAMEKAEEEVRWGRGVVFSFRALGRLIVRRVRVVDYAHATSFKPEDI